MNKARMALFSLLAYLSIWGLILAINASSIAHASPMYNCGYQLDASKGPQFGGQNVERDQDVMIISRGAKYVRFAALPGKLSVMTRNCSVVAYSSRPRNTISTSTRERD